jgi:formylmethanofuran dehydrogenase subunit E
MKFGEYTRQEYFDKVTEFHGTVAPGLVVGGFMVNLALEHLPKERLFDAYCETKACLPDAIQLLTPCSFGNGWMRVLDLGRFALVLYDKYTGEGVRVFLDAGQLESWTEIKNWFMKLKSKHEQDKDKLLAEIERAGTSILGIQKVLVNPDLLKKKKGGPNAVCPQCHEAYPAAQGDVCKGCREKLPYKAIM